MTVTGSATDPEDETLSGDLSQWNVISNIIVHP